VDDVAAFGRLVEALRPWLDHLVIVGGWAHHLHRYHPLAGAPPYAPLRTRDMDLAFSPSAPLRGDISAALQAAGFVEELAGEHTPPVTHYRIGEEDQGFYAEFLVPQTGSGVRRSGRRDATLARAGVTAQKLRHLDILLIHPWAVRLQASAGIPVSRPTDLSIANPVSFIAQKLLIHGRREPGKKAQDVLYVHDTLELFGRSLDALRGEWLERVSPGLHRRTAREIDQLRRVQFETVNDVIRNAVRIPQDRALLAERVQAACALGLERIFGPGSAGSAARA